MTQPSAPFISPDVTAKGIEELLNRDFVNSYDVLWGRIEDEIDPIVSQIIEYGTVWHGDREYTLRALEMGERGMNEHVIFANIHPYEKSGSDAVQDVKNLERLAKNHKLKIIPAPFPFSYETEARFMVGRDQLGKPVIVDTNRDHPIDETEIRTEESRLLRDYILGSAKSYENFIDLHETPETDVTIWRPFAQEYMGRVLGPDDLIVPQGAFVITQKAEDQDANRAQLDFGRAVMSGITKHSPIAPEDTVLGHENINGVVNAPALAGSTRTFMMDVAGAKHVVVTELNPDMPNMDHAKATQAQAAAINAAISFDT